MNDDDDDISNDNNKRQKHDEKNYWDETKSDTLIYCGGGGSFSGTIDGTVRTIRHVQTASWLTDQTHHSIELPMAYRA